MRTATIVGADTLAPGRYAGAIVAETPTPYGSNVTVQPVPSAPLDGCAHEIIVSRPGEDF